MSFHSDATSPSLRTPLHGDDIVSGEHAIMSPNLSACNSVKNSRVPAILGSMEILTCILISNSKIGAVIGKGGSIIKRIRESSGAKITICGNCSGASGLGGGENAADDSGDRMVTIAGVYLTVLAAFSAIVRQTEPVFGKGGNDEPTRSGGHNSGSTCVRLLVPNNKAGGLIGHGGSTIRAIREQSCARIEISTQGLAVWGGGVLDRVVTIMGTFSACIQAYEMICLQLVGIPNAGPFSTSPTSQNDAEHRNNRVVHAGGMVNSPMSHIHQQSRSGHQQQNLGCGVGVYHGTMALQFSPVPQVGPPFHGPPSFSSRTQQFERSNGLPPSGYVPPTTWENLALDQGGLHASPSSSTFYHGYLPHSLSTSGRRRSCSTPDSYCQSSSSPSLIAGFTAGVIRNVNLKDDEKRYNPSLAASVSTMCIASPAPIKITVDMDIPYEALTAMRLDHGFSNIMNISGAVLEELQAMPKSTLSGLRGGMDEVVVKGGGGVKRVEQLDVEELNKQKCDSSEQKDECNGEDSQVDLLEQQEKPLPLEWGNDCCYGYSLPSAQEVSFPHSISTTSLGDSASFNSSLSSLKDNAAFNEGCKPSSNRISITGTLEVK